MQLPHYTIIMLVISESYIDFIVALGGVTHKYSI